MALEIEGATVGYDVSGIKSLKDDIRANVVEKATTDLRTHVKDLEDAVDEIWAGNSAKTFKDNMQKDVQAVIAAMEAGLAALESEINQVAKRMQEIDDNLIKKKA
jgi:uncharacterized protein YukE